VSILHFVRVCLFLSCVLFCEKRLKLVTVKRSERTSQSFTSLCYEVWVSEVNVHDFFESMSTSTVDVDCRPIFFGMRAHRRSISTDFFFGMNPYRRSISTDFWVKSTVDQISTVFSNRFNPYQPSISTVFSSRWILIERRYRLYSQVGESLSTVDIDRDRSTSRLKSNRPIDDTCAKHCPRMEKSHSCWPRPFWCVVNMFHKNGMRPLTIDNGTKCYSILYCNSQSLHIRLNYKYSVILVIVDSLPGNTKKQGVGKFVAFGVRLVHSWVANKSGFLNFSRCVQISLVVNAKRCVLKWVLFISPSGLKLQCQNETNREIEKGIDD